MEASKLHGEAWLPASGIGESKVLGFATLDGCATEIIVASMHFMDLLWEERDSSREITK